MDLKTCEICKKEHHKYKCPRCLVKYCSLQCFKVHKEDQCIKKSETVELHTRCASIASHNRYHAEKEDGEISDEEEEITEDYVSPDKLGKLGGDEDLQNMLKNPHLRQILTHLSNSAEPGKDMEAAMHEPIFVEFADRCLQTVEKERYIET